MKKYFIKLNEEQRGPLTIDELKEMNLTDQFFYWTDGNTAWKPITELKEIDGFILKLPPIEDKNQIKIQEVTQKLNKSRIWIIILGGVVLFALFGGFSDKYDLLEEYRGLAGSSYGDEAALKVRGVLLIFSTLISSVFGYLVYFQQTMTLYKKLYEKKEL